IWQPAIIDRLPWDEWVQAGRPPVRERAKEKARAILAEHQPEPLPNAERLREIIAEYERLE
ncbi:MAG: trimethylamine methyltransferase, partial [Chloroflexota bacterium]